MNSSHLKRCGHKLGLALLLTIVLPGPAIAGLDMLPLHITALQEDDIARAEQPHGNGPLRFAVAAPVTVDLDGGIWEQLSEHTMRWRTRVGSPGAQSLSLRLAQFAGAPDAQLWVRSASSDMTQGPYDISDIDKHGHLWTAMVFDDTLVIDLLVPATQREALQLSIIEAHHGFRDMRKQLSPGGSGSCNIDVACDQGDDWREQIRSVAGLVVDGTGFCTGNLVNNSAQDGDPLILTGHHCGFRANNAGSLVAYWNFQADDCNGEAPAFDQSQNGAEFVATHEASDHTLLRLKEKPDPAFDVYYSGWDARATATVSNGVTIHHPRTDVKKISLFNSSATKDVETIDDQTVAVWRVNWDQGTTERGSSGAGLWNSDGNLVGTLFGGRASCSNQDGEDFYGRLDVGWEGGGSSDTHMKSCLDKTASGSRVREGIDASALNAPSAPSPKIEDCQRIAGDNDGGGSFWAPLLLVGAGLRRLRRTT